MKAKKLTKIVTSMLLTMCMLASLLPANSITAFAADGVVSASIYLDDGDGRYTKKKKVVRRGKKKYYVGELG